MSEDKQLARFWELKFRAEQQYRRELEQALIQVKSHVEKAITILDGDKNEIHSPD